MSKDIFIGRKLREARMFRAKTVDMLAQDTKINKKDILAFEEEKYKPTLENEMKMANALNVPKEFFKKQDGAKLVIDNTHIRPESKLPKTEQIAIKEKLALTHKILTFVEGYLTFPQMNLPQNINANGNVDDLASSVRRYWEISDGIIGNMTSLLEVNGILISDVNIDKKNALAFSQKSSTVSSTRYIISLGNDKKSACQRNYDLAYELGYIISTESKIQAKKFSKEEFAAAFLLPRETFTRSLQYAKDLEDFVELKKQWIVPIEVMIFRAYNLGEISYKKYMHLLGEMDKRGWLGKEPLEANIKATSPMLLKKAVDMILDEKILTKEGFMLNIGNFGVSIYAQDIEELLSLKTGKLSEVKKNFKNNNVTKVDFKKKRK